MLGLFSRVTLLAHPHMEKEPSRRAAWYIKEKPTFSDALALVRRRLWRQRFCMSLGICRWAKATCRKGDIQKPLAVWLEPLTEALTEALCYAASWIKSSLEPVLIGPRLNSGEPELGA